MNYASGLMLGMSLAQGLKSVVDGKSSMGGQGGMFQTLSGMGGGKRGNSKGFSDMFGNARIFNRAAGDGVAKSANLYNKNPMESLSAESFKLVSSLPGRRRYRAYVITEGLKALMEERFSKLEYIKTIEVNPVSGSILITFDEKDIASVLRLENWMRERLFSGGDASFKHDVKMNQMLYGSITESVKNTVQHVSNMLIKESHGLLDIKSLLSVVFTILGLRKVILNGEFPSGVQMLWWAVSLMRGGRAV